MQPPYKQVFKTKVSDRARESGFIREVFMKKKKYIKNKTYLMELQDMIITKTLPAYLARIRLLSRMRPRVYFQLFTASESFLAYGADVRFLASVGPHVNHQLT